MNITIVYDSQTGTTKGAAEKMGQIFEKQGHRCRVESVSKANPALVQSADLICLGSWTKGWFIIRQRPTAGIMKFMERLDNVAGKDVVVFCTYKLAIGSTLRQMAAGMERQGARVVGLFKFRGPDPDGRFESFAESLK